MPRGIRFNIALLPFAEYPAIDSAARYLPRFGASCYRFPFVAPFFRLVVWTELPNELMSDAQVHNQGGNSSACSGVVLVNEELW